MSNSLILESIVKLENEYSTTDCKETKNRIQNEIEQLEGNIKK